MLEKEVDVVQLLLILVAKINHKEIVVTTSSYWINPVETYWNPNRLIRMAVHNKAKIWHVSLKMFKTVEL